MSLTQTGTEFYRLLLANFQMLRGCVATAELLVVLLEVLNLQLSDGITVKILYSPSNITVHD